MIATKKRTAVTAVLICTMLLLAACTEAPASSSTPSSSSPSSSSVPDKPEAEEPPYAKGVLTETQYTSEYWKIQFTAPESAMIATEQQINELMDIGGEALGTDEKLLDGAKEAITSAYELMAFDGASGSSLALLSQQLPLSGMTEEIALKGIVQGVTAANPNGTIAMENEGKPVDETIAGIPFKKISYTMKTQGAPDTYQAQYLHIRGKQMLAIVVGYSDSIPGAKDSAAGLLAALKPL